MPIIRSLIAAAAAAALLAPTAAAAADAGGAGWWTTSPVAVAPDAQGALVVQGGVQADQPVSYAAVQFTLADGESASHLTLAVAPGSASTPAATLTVCPLTGSFAPTDGGAMADAPPYDCASKASAPAANGVYTFDVSALAATGTLALAVLPGWPSDRVALSKPDAAALETAAGPSSAGTDAASGADAGSAQTFAAPATPSFTSGSFDVPPPPSVAADVLDVPRSAVGAPGSAPAAASAPVAPAASGTRGGRRTAPLVFVLLVLVAGGLWLGAGRTTAEAEPAEA